MRFRLVSLLVLLSPACQTTPAPESVQADVPRAAAEAPRAPAQPAQAQRLLYTERQTYSADEEVRLILQNQARHEIGYNLCMSALERRVGEEWQAVEAQPQEVCPAILRLLAPDQSTYYMFRLDRDLPAGEYRFRTQIENLQTGERQAFFSNPFMLTR